MMSREDAIKWFHDELQERCLPEDKQNAYEEALYALNGASIREDFDEEWKRYMDSRKDDLSGRIVTVNVKDVARHFAEWGAIHLNARKEE